MPVVVFVLLVEGKAKLPGWQVGTSSSNKIIIVGKLVIAIMHQIVNNYRTVSQLFTSHESVLKLSYSHKSLVSWYRWGSEDEGESQGVQVKSVV